MPDSDIPWLNATPDPQIVYSALKRTLNFVGPAERSQHQRLLMSSFCPPLGLILLDGSLQRRRFDDERHRSFSVAPLTFERSAMRRLWWANSKPH